MTPSESMPKYTINVRGMVEFLLQHGDIVPGDSFFSPERAQLGAEIHRKLQDKCKIEKKDILRKNRFAVSKKKTGFFWNWKDAAMDFT